MLKLKNVRSSMETIPELDINVDTVYIRNNIHRIINQDNIEEWEYDEKQLSIDEYLRDTVPTNQNLTEETLAELSILFSKY